MTDTPRIPSPKVDGIKSVQDDFKRYQSCAFMERSSSFFALELAGECGELCNLEKKAWRDPESPVDIDWLADEAADVFIALMNFANSRSLDLESAVRKKLAIIEERRVTGRMGVARKGEP